LTIIPIRAIIPRAESTLMGNPCIKCPHPTPIILKGIIKMRITGWLYVLKVKAITAKIRNKITGKTLLAELESF
jgi:hypothetical protein